MGDGTCPWLGHPCLGTELETQRTCPGLGTGLWPAALHTALQDFYIELFSLASKSAGLSVCQKLHAVFGAKRDILG